MDVEVAYMALGIELKRVGMRWKGVCPFHAESDASFVVYPDASYHCFGCQAHGTYQSLTKYYGEEYVIVPDIGSIQEKYPVELNKLKTEQQDELWFELEDKNFNKKEKAWKAFDFVWWKVRSMEETGEEFVRIILLVKSKFKEILKFVKSS